MSLIVSWLPTQVQTDVFSYTKKAYSQIYLCPMNFVHNPDKGSIWGHYSLWVSTADTNDM